MHFVRRGANCVADSCFKCRASPSSYKNMSKLHIKLLLIFVTVVALFHRCAIFGLRILYAKLPLESREITPLHLLCLILNFVMLRERLKYEL